VQQPEQDWVVEDAVDTVVVVLVAVGIVAVVVDIVAADIVAVVVAVVAVVKADMVYCFVAVVVAVVRWNYLYPLFPLQKNTDRL